MKFTNSVTALPFALALWASGQLALHASNPPILPAGKTMGSNTVPPPPSPTQPCWMVSGNRATFYWPGAPPGGIWFGPVPRCAARPRAGRIPSAGGAPSAVQEEASIANGPSGNRACPGHVSGNQCNGTSGGGGPAVGSSLRERAFIDLAPNQPGLGIGELTYYVDEPNLNLGSPELLAFNSLVNMEAHYTAVDPGGGAPPLNRYTIFQPDGSSIVFNLRSTKDPGQPYVKGPPVGEAASSQTGVTWTLSDGSFVEKTEATQLSQYVPGSGWVHFPKAGGLATGLTTITGRKYTFSTTGIEVIRKLPGGGIAANGLRNSGTLRQIKTVAGLLDIVPYTGGPGPSTRSFEIKQYAASQVGAKVSGIYTVAGSPIFSISFSAPSGTTGQLTTVRSLGTEKYTTNHTVSVTDGVATWTQMHTNGPFQFRRTLVTPTYGTTRSSTWTAKLLAAPGMGPIDPSGAYDYTLANTSTSFFPTSSIQSFSSGGGAIVVERTQGFTSIVGQTESTSDSMTGVTTSTSYDAANKRMLWSRTLVPPIGPDGSTPLSITWDYDYTLTAGEPNLPFDFRPRKVTQKYGTEVVSKEYYAYPTVAGEYVQIIERSIDPLAAFGAAGSLRTVDTFYGSGPNQGRPKQSKAENGTLTTYDYTDLPGGGLLATVTETLTAAGLPVSGSSVRTKFKLDVRGLPLEITRACYLDTGAWLDYEKFECTWDDYGNPTKTERWDLISPPQMRVLESRTWDGVRPTSVTDEAGVTTEYEYYPETVIPWKTRRLAVAASGSYPAQPEILTTFTGTYSMDSEQLPLRTERIATTTAGSGAEARTLVETTVIDGMKRPLSHTDANGLKTSFNYSTDFSTITTTFPNNGIEIRKFSPNGELLSIQGDAVIGSFYHHGALVGGGTFDKVYTVADEGPRYQTSESDIAGRVIRTKRPSYSGVILETNQSYDSNGNLSLVTSPGEPAHIYEYDSTGGLFRTTISGDNTTSTLTSTTDRITETTTTAQSLGGNPWNVTTKAVYASSGNSTKTVVGTSRTQLAGFTGVQSAISEQIDPSNNITRNLTTVDRAAKLTVSTLVRPGATDNATSTVYNGRLQRQHESGSSGDIVHGYDSLGRTVSVKQPRHAMAAITEYEPNKNRVATTKDAAGNPTSYEYGTSGAKKGKVITITAPDTSTTTFDYDLLNRRTFVSGTGTYPVAYDYNAYGELWRMRTWRSGTPPAGGDVTTWDYQPSTGLLLSKTDAATKPVNYTYHPDGRPYTRSWARGVTSTYEYNSFGQIWKITHSDGGITPGSTFVYDRLGRPDTTTQVGGHSWAYTYDATTLRPDTETITYDTGAGILTRVIDRSFDSLLRPSGWQLKNGATMEYDFIRTYESAASRPYSFTGGGPFFSGAGPSFTYSYVPASPRLVQGITSGSTVSTYNAWEANRDVVDYKQNTFGGSIISKYDYTVNDMSRRSAVAETGSAYAGSPSVEWGYNARGEVTLHDHTTGAYDSVYEFDTIGNRTKAAAGTTLPGSPNYASNNLNQYTTIGGVSPGYDDDGNLTSDAGGNTHGTARTYQWDAENQLRQVSSGAVADYRYDPHGRRISKAAGGVTTWFIYDGWNLVAEYQSGALTRTHLWGLDLSGTTQGAGGVGGLLCTSIGGTKYYPLYDGNGNICQYLDGSGGLAAHYEYGPFGHLLNTPGTGSTPTSFSFRFSTKFNDAETDFFYFGFRYYSSWLGRWISRDPLAEKGGINLNAMNRNNPVNRHDRLGLADFDVTEQTEFIDPAATTLFDITALNFAGYSKNAKGEYSVPGYKVDYHSDPGCGCKGNITLVQAQNWNGGKNYIDSPKSHPMTRLPGVSDNPGYIPSTTAGDGSFFDAPTNAGFIWGLASGDWNMTVCAVCNDKIGKAGLPHQRFLGCVSFAFDNQTRKLKSGGGTGIVPFAHNDYFTTPSTQMGFAEENYFKSK